MRSRTRLVALAATALLLVACGVLAYHYWPAPNRIEACGRTFGHTDGTVGAGPFTLAEIQEQENGMLHKIRTIRGGREVWARPGCGLGIYLRVGDDRFLGYGLLGGP